MTVKRYPASITDDGRLTLPAQILKSLEFRPHEQLIVSLDQGVLTVQAGELDWRDVIGSLPAKTELSNEDLDSLIDEAAEQAALERFRRSFVEQLPDQRVTVTSKGQVTLPIDMRRLLNVKTGTQLRASVHDRSIVLEPDRLTWRDVISSVKSPAGWSLDDLDKIRTISQEAATRRVAEDFAALSEE